MKKHPLIQTLLGAALLAAFSFLLPPLVAPPPASAAPPPDPITYRQFGTNNQVLTNAQTITLTNNVAPIQKDTGLAVGVLMAAGGATTANLTFELEGTIDGTNYTTAPVASWTWPLNGTTAVCRITNLPPTIINNFKYLRAKVSNGHTNNVVLTNFHWAFFN